MNKDLCIDDRFWFVSINTIMKKFSKEAARKMTVKDYSIVKRVYEESGGSWEHLAEGVLESWDHMRKACQSFLEVRKKQGKSPYDTEGKE